jgi:hypothetical protein
LTPLDEIPGLFARKRVKEFLSGRGGRTAHKYAGFSRS